MHLMCFNQPGGAEAWSSTFNNYIPPRLCASALHKKWLVVALCAICLLACRQSGHKNEKDNVATDNVPANDSVVVFHLSKAPPPYPEDADNWCRSVFDAALIVNADKADYNKRYFYLPPGITKVVIGPKLAKAAFMLRSRDNKDVDVFTGANYPECLAMPNNFSLTAGGNVLNYSNQNRSVTFSVTARREPAGYLAIVIEPPPSIQYTLSVSTCSECR